MSLRQERPLNHNVMGNIKLRATLSYFAAASAVLRVGDFLISAPRFLSHVCEVCRQFSQWCRFWTLRSARVRLILPPAMLASRGLGYVTRKPRRPRSRLLETGPGAMIHGTLTTASQILLSFMVTAGLAIVLSISVIIADFRGKESIIRRKLLNGYSDSQILQGIGIQGELRSALERSPSQGLLTGDFKVLDWPR